MKVPAEPYVALSRESYDPDLRIALVHDGAQDLDALVSILCNASLAPNAGVLPLQRASRLVADPPEAIVVAVDFGQAGGAMAVRSLRRIAPAAPIVLIARDTTGRFAREALNAGAQAFVSDKDAAVALAPAVRAVVAGLVCAPRTVRRLVARPTFSHREKQVLALLATGISNKEIAARLWLAESTIKAHISSAFSKLGVRCRKDAIAVVLDPEEGLMATAFPPDFVFAPGAEDGLRQDPPGQLGAPAPTP